MKRFSQKSGYSTMAELNVTPLLDLAFVLLIIFIITTPLLEQSIDISLPTASKSNAEVDPRSVKTVEMDAAGTIFLDRQKVSLEDLQNTLRAWKAKDPNAAVALRFDHNLKYQQMVNVFDALEKANISKMGLINLPDETTRRH